nr:unnamed protein product [Callosobruchus analis]
MLCDSKTNYMIDAIPYMEKGTNSNEEPLASFLGRDLLKLCTIGTITANKGEIPSQLLQPRPMKSSMFCNDGRTTLVSYKPKKNKSVVLLSTAHGKDTSALSGKPELSTQLFTYQVCMDKFSLPASITDDADQPDPFETDEEFEYQPSESNSSESDENSLAVANPLEQQKSRKRVKREASWACNRRKMARASGLAYTNVRGSKVPAKKFKLPECRCNPPCIVTIGIDQTKVIFDNFYKLANFDMQSAYIFGQINVLNRIRTYTNRDTSRRQFTKHYFMANDKGVDTRVCKEFFKQTLQVSDGRLSRVLKHKPGGIPPKDKRGRHPAFNKTSSEKVNEVKHFIQRFPVYESHYARHKSVSRKYLAPDLNINIMYKLYKQSTNAPVSNYVFRSIFNTEFNLHFHAPIADSCRRCDEFNNKLKVVVGEERRAVELEQELHLRKAELARHEMKRDSEEAACRGSETAIIAFDLMKTLPTPVLSTGITYYKRQLWTYCLGIHNLANNSAVMCVWNESIASRGPQEIGSCIMKYCKAFVREKKLIMYSDQCGGQNRNLKMALLCDYIANSTDFSVEEIDHKFLVSGHSYLACDQDFGLVEKEKKYHKDIFIPKHWSIVIASARKKKPFQVIEMCKHDFFSTKRLENAVTNRKIGEGGVKVQWMKIQWLHFSSSTKHRFGFKLFNSKEILFDTADVRKRKTVSTVETLDLLYPNGRPIEEKKCKDLQFLLPYIPPIHHTFYQNLKTSSLAVDELADEHNEEEYQ